MIIIMLIGTIGGWIGYRMKIPAGFLFGSLMATAMLNHFLGSMSMPSEIGVIVQIAAGGVIGSRITKKDIHALKTIIISTIILVFGMIIMNIGLGFIIHFVSGIDLATSLLASAPGGLTEMSLVALSLGGDAVLVAIIQLIRIMSVLSISPFILRSICKGSNLNRAINCEQNNQPEGIFQNHPNNKNIVITAIVSIIAGVLGASLPIPVGALTFSMIATAILNISKHRGQTIKYQRIICQIISGTLIGTRFTINNTLYQRENILAVFILIIGMIVLNIVIGFVISKFGKIDFPTALFASAPGGMSEIALIAKDYGADETRVVVMQLMRLICVIVLFPSLIEFVCTIFNN